MLEITLNEFALQLTGRQYTELVTTDIYKQAKANGFIIVSACADNEMDVDGAMVERFRILNGQTKTLYIDGTNKGRKVEIVCKKDAQVTPANPLHKVRESKWLFTIKHDSEIERFNTPYETFTVFRGKQILCIGLVFNINQVIKR